MMHTTKVIIAVCVALVVFAGDVATNCFAQELTIIYPEVYADTEAPNGAGNIGTFDPGRLQRIYSAAEAFPQLPITYHTVTGFRWRPDGNASAAYTATTDKLEIRLSTTEVEPGELSLRYADNIGDDETLVFAGALTLSTQNSGPTGGPKDFDIVIDFTTPFHYDPSAGNLLMDMMWFSPFSNVEVDACTLDVFPPCEWVGHIGDPTAEFADFEGVDGGIVQWVFIADEVSGDFNADGVLDMHDIDQLSNALREGVDERQFDLNGDGVTSQLDRVVWIRDLKQTYYGDANLDGEFNSGDLVLVLGAGEYEDELMDNSGWATGDWDGDREFTSADLVVALADGGYEHGPRAAVLSVPEPKSLTVLSMVLLLVAKLSLHRKTLETCL